MQIHLTTPDFSLAQNRPSRTVNYNSLPLELFIDIVIRVSRASELSTRESLAQLSQVSWQWHQYSLHIDSIVAFLNADVLDLTEVPLFKHSNQFRQQQQILSCFIEVLYNKRSIESFTHIQNQRPLQIAPPMQSQPVKTVLESCKDNCESSEEGNWESTEEEDEIPKLEPVLLNMNPVIDGKPTLITKKLIRLSEHGLKNLVDTDKETLNQLLNDIRNLRMSWSTSWEDALIPADRLLQLTNVTTLSITSGYKKFHPPYKSLSKLSELSITLFDIDKLNDIHSDNFPSLKRLSITSDHSPCTEFYGYPKSLPKSLESVYFYQMEIDSRLFELSENLKSLVLEQVLGFRAEDHPKFPNLENFKISFNPRHPADRKLFTFDMPRLRRLDIEAARGFSSFKLNATGLQSLKINCPELEEPGLSHWPQHKSISILQPLWLKTDIEDN